jgi:hypothetical protein
MKKFLFIAASLLAFTCASLTANAQRPAPGPEDTVSFRVSPQTAGYVVANVSDPEIQAAIAVALGDSRDSNARPRIVITEAQVITILESITRMPEGIAAEPNKLLLLTLSPYLATRPWLAENAGAVLDRNTSIFDEMVAEGFRRIARINTSVRRN